MTIADLDKMEGALAARLGPWLAKADKVIRSSVADAHAHAAKAITDTLRTTPDGRPSARKVDRSPSYQAALTHLDDLQCRLIGPSKDSLDGLLRDARAAFYVDSIKLWLPHIPEKYRASAEPAPTKIVERFFRGAIIHGYRLDQELSPDVQRTKDHLFASVNSAGRGGSSQRTARSYLDTWRAQAVDRLNLKAGSILSDSDKAIHEATGWLMIHPDYRGERKLTAGGVHF